MKIIVSASSLFFILSCGQNPADPTTAVKSKKITMSVYYTKPWTGALSHDGATESISGSNNVDYSYNLTGSFYYISAQKYTNDSSTLVVKITKETTLSNGTVNIVTEKEASTSASYGVASAYVSY